MLPDPLNEIKLEELPNDSLLDVANACGMAVAYSLMKEMPGISFIVPQTGLRRVQQAAERAGRKDGPFLIEDLWNYNWRFLARVCGLEVVLSLFEHLGNTPVIIPTNPLYKMLHRYIHTYLEHGENDWEMTRTLGISRSLFYRLLDEKMPSKHAPDLNQMKLFEFTE